MSEIESLISRHQIPHKTRGTNVGKDMVNICCPFCSEDRFHCGINIEKLWFKCFVCSEGGGWWKISQKLSQNYPHINWRSISVQNYPKFIKAPTTQEKPTKKLLFDPNKELSGRLKHWLYSSPIINNRVDFGYSYRNRFIDQKIRNDYKVYEGVGKLAGYAVFVENNNIIARKYNPILPGPKWFKDFADSSFLFGAQNVVKVQPKIGVITEGIFDCFRFPVGTSVAILGVAVSTSVISKINETFKNTRELVLFLDRGVNESTTRDLYFCLTDLGFSVKYIDWEKLNPSAKDVDELYLLYGKEYLYSLEPLKDLKNYEIIDLF